jgi:hypothetical protein
VKKRTMSVILFLVIVFILLVAFLLVTHKPIVDYSWKGVPAIETTTPTPTLLPDQGWWKNLPTAPGHRVIPFFSPTH